MQQAVNPMTPPRQSLQQQFDAFQRQNKLGQYAPIQIANAWDWGGSSARSPGLGGGNIPGTYRPDGGAVGNPSGGNIPNSYGNDPGYGRPPGFASMTIAQPQPQQTQRYPNYDARGNVIGWSNTDPSQNGPLSGLPSSRPAQQSTYAMQGGLGGGAAQGIGGSTPFLSGIQQQLGQMFGQTPGLGFRPQQAPAPQAAPQMNTSYMIQPKPGMPQTTNGGIQLRSGLKQPMLLGGMR